MTRAAAALVVSVLCWLASTSQAAPCPLHAELTGDPAAVAQVNAELARLGVATGPAAPGCHALRAEVQLDDSGAIAVAIVDEPTEASRVSGESESASAAGGVRATMRRGADESGEASRAGAESAPDGSVAATDSARRGVTGHRSERRVVSGPAMAAAWIDSWLRDDLDRGWIVVETHRPVRAEPDLVPRPPGATPVSSHLPERSLFERGAVGIDFESLYGSIGAPQGFGATGCVSLGQLCVGVRVRSLRDVVRPPEPVDTVGEDAALATANRGFAIGRMKLIGELGLGAGRFITRRDAICKPGCDGGMAPGDPPDPSMSRARWGVSSIRARAAAVLRLGVPLFDHVWLAGHIGVVYVPFAHTQPFAIENYVDPKQLPQSTDPTFSRIAGEPDVTIQLGVSVDVGLL